MINYDGKNWFSIVTRMNGSVLPRLMPKCIAAAAIGAGAVYLLETKGLKIPALLHTMIGIALGLLLVFRTNASYDRFWEGRKLLGSMVNRTRDLMRQVVAYVPGDDEASRAQKARLRNWICAFYRLSCQTLRLERDLNYVSHLLTEEERAILEKATHRAPTITAWISNELHKIAASGRMSQQELLAMDVNLVGFNDYLGGAERIVKTPVPFAYAQHLKIFVFLFCYSAPFAMADVMGWKTPVGAFVLAFALLGIDEIGVEIEEPFGYDPNDLPLDQIGDGIEKATSDILEYGLAPTSSNSGVIAKAS